MWTKLIKHLNQISTLLIIVIILVYVLASRVITRKDVMIPYKINKFYFILFMCLMSLIIIFFIIILLNKNLLYKSKLFVIGKEKLNKDLNVVSIFVFNKVFKYKVPNIYIYLKNKYYFLFLFYVIFSCISRFSVLVIFCIDVLYFCKISYFYKAMPLLILPSIFRIAYYFLKRFLEMKTEIIAPKIQTVYANNVIEIKQYIQKAAVHRLKFVDKFFDGYILLDPIYFNEWEERTGKKADARGSIEKFKKSMDLMIEQQMVLSNFELKKNYIEPLFTLLVRIGYFIIWSYIFYINDPITFYTVIDFIFNCHIYIKEPFSET